MDIGLGSFDVYSNDHIYLTVQVGFVHAQPDFNSNSLPHANKNIQFKVCEFTRYNIGHVFSATLVSINGCKAQSNFIHALMKTLDWSVETLGCESNSTGLCIHLEKPE
jgi:hypothetical protein